MKKAPLVTVMTELLQGAVDQEGEHSTVQVTATSPLVGGEAVLSSMGLVSYVMDVEAMIAEKHDIEVALVNENALSRSQSPFRTVDTLADYVLELVVESAGESAA
jgi:hypothetical protein